MMFRYDVNFIINLRQMQSSPAKSIAQDENKFVKTADWFMRSCGKEKDVRTDLTSVKTKLDEALVHPITIIISILKDEMPESEWDDFISKIRFQPLRELAAAVSRTKRRSFDVQAKYPELMKRIAQLSEKHGELKKILERIETSDGLRDLLVYLLRESEETDKLLNELKERVVGEDGASSQDDQAKQVLDGVDKLKNDKLELEKALQSMKDEQAKLMKDSDTLREMTKEIEKMNEDKERLRKMNRKLFGGQLDIDDVLERMSDEIFKARKEKQELEEAIKNAKARVFDIDEEEGATPQRNIELISDKHKRLKKEKQNADDELRESAKKLHVAEVSLQVAEKARDDLKKNLADEERRCREFQELLFSLNQTVTLLSARTPGSGMDEGVIEGRLKDINKSIETLRRDLALKDRPIQEVRVIEAPAAKEDPQLAILKEENKKLKQQLSDLTKELENKAKDHDKNRKDLSTANTNIGKIQAELDELKKREARVNGRIGSIAGVISKDGPAKGGAPKVDDQLDTIEKYVQAQKASEQSRDAADNLNKDMNKEIADLKRQIRDLTNEKNAQAKKLAEVENAAQKLARELNDLKNLESQVKAKVGSIADCLSDEPSVEERSVELYNQLDAIEAYIQARNASARKNAALVSELQNIAKKTGSGEGGKDAPSDPDALARHLNDRVEDMKREVERLKKQNDDLNKDKSERSKKLQDAESEVKKLREQLDAMKSTLDNQGQLGHQVKSLQDELENCQKKMKELEKQVEDLEQLKKKVSDKVRAISDLISGEEPVAERAVNLEEELDGIEEYIQAQSATVR